MQLRYRTMLGNWVRPRIGGWDTHGLAVEIEVEKKLKLNGKKGIIEMGVAEFNEHCKKSVFKYEQDWIEMSNRIGFWLDLENAYITMRDNYIESIWWSLKTLFEKKLLYKGLRVVPLCTRCGTTLSSHELAQGYKDVKDVSVFVKFKVKGSDFSIVAWTTTPWTLLSNIALVVNRDLEYSLVENQGEKLLVASELVEQVFSEKKEAIQTFTGKDLEGKEYEPVFPYFSELSEKNGFKVAMADYVTTNDGTGIVHSSPLHGKDDEATARKYKMPTIKCVDITGKFTSDIPPLEGIWVKDADAQIISMLEENGSLLKQEIYEHNYPHCWRCSTPLLYYGTDSWFIAMSKLRKNLLKNNQTVQWQPPHIKDGRFGKFLDTVVDWNLSRSRFWGTPLPAWICNKCEEVEIIGSKEELGNKGKIPKDFELHRPWVDEIKWKCAKCAGMMIREPYVIDVWYDSGSSFFAQYHYPFENAEQFNKDFPFSWITEALDQTRGWFYSLFAISTALFDKTSYKSVLCMNFILDKNGQKMSKSKGNVIDSTEIFNELGADSLRWYLSSFQPWNETNLSLQLVKEAQKKGINTLWNIYSFFVTNANVDNYNPNKRSNRRDRFEIDLWLLSRLESVIKICNVSIAEMACHKAVRAIEFFIVEEMSNWYIRRSRRRFYSPDMTKDKQYGYDTIYEVLVALCKLMAPIIPFLPEELYQNLVARSTKLEIASIHAEFYPQYEKQFVDKKLEEKMTLILNITTAARSARSQANIKLRQPLQSIKVVTREKQETMQDFLPIVLEELNIKDIEFLTPEKTLSEYAITPNFRILAPQVKADVNKVKDSLKNMEKSEITKIKTEIEKTGFGTLLINETERKLAKDAFIITVNAPEGYVTANSDGIQVFLSTKVTPELKEEGLAREIIRRIQEMRKIANLDYVDRIFGNIMFDGVEIKNAFNKFESYIAEETQADNLKVPNLKADLVKEWKINGKSVKISIMKAVKGVSS